MTLKGKGLSHYSIFENNFKPHFIKFVNKFIPGAAYTYRTPLDFYEIDFLITINKSTLVALDLHGDTHYYSNSP